MENLTFEEVTYQGYVEDLNKFMNPKYNPKWVESKPYPMNLILKTVGPQMSKNGYEIVYRRMDEFMRNYLSDEQLTIIYLRLQLHKSRKKVADFLGITYSILETRERKTFEYIKSCANAEIFGESFKRSEHYPIYYESQVQSMKQSSLTEGW